MSTQNNGYINVHIKKTEFEFYKEGIVRTSEKSQTYRNTRGYVKSVIIPPTISYITINIHIYICITKYGENVLYAPLFIMTKVCMIVHAHTIEQVVIMIRLSSLIIQHSCQ